MVSRLGGRVWERGCGACAAAPGEQSRDVHDRLANPRRASDMYVCVAAMCLTPTQAIL
jgi:hypothetical protein